MKTNIIIKALLIYLIIVSSNIKTETILLTQKRKIEQNGNMIFASKGVAKIPSKNLQNEGDKFIYDKLNSELTIFDNVKYLDKENDITIKSQKLLYKELKNELFSQNETKVNIGNKYQVNSSNVLFERNINLISSNKFTKVNDQTDNKFEFKDGLIFNTFSEIISSKQVKIIDQNRNKYFFKNSKLNLKLNEIVGKEVKVDFIDSFFGNINNDPILMGKSILSNNENTKIYKTVFSTCNIEIKDAGDGSCKVKFLHMIKQENYLSMKIHG